MTEQTSTLYAKLLGETAVISWAELQPFFARGALLQVDAALDLVEVAEALAGDDREKVAAWLSGGGLQGRGGCGQGLPRTRPDPLGGGGGALGGHSGTRGKSDVALIQGGFLSLDPG